jgi:hypothetical protein
MRTIPSSLFPLLLTLLFRASLPPTQTSTQADEISQPGAGGLTIHVAPGGDDHWSGALTHPNAARTDGPLATLKGARDRIRTLRHEQKIGFGPITVMIAAGTYPVSGPVVYELADGGTAAAPVIYQAEPGAWPIFDGGRAITGFSRRPDGLWTAKVPDVAAGRWTFEQLFVNGRRATRARTPNEFYYYMLKRVTQGIDPATGQTVPVEKRAFIARGEDLEPLKGLSPEQLHDVNVVVFHSWEVSRHRIASVDHKTGMVILTGPAPWAFFAWGPNQRYYFENVPNTFDRPGEWFLDRDGTLVYRPLPGEDPATAIVVAPGADSFLEIKGKPNAGAIVEYLSFKGMTFRHSRYVLPPQGHGDGQAAVSIPAVIMAGNARYLTLTDCRIEHTGIYGVWFRHGCADCRIERRALIDLGAGGVRMGETGISSFPWWSSGQTRIRWWGL